MPLVLFIFIWPIRWQPADCRFDPGSSQPFGINQPIQATWSTSTHSVRGLSLLEKGPWSTPLSMGLPRSIYLYVWIFQQIPFCGSESRLPSGIPDCWQYRWFGSGLVFRYGGTIGGSDIITSSHRKKFGIQPTRPCWALIFLSCSFLWPHFHPKNDVTPWLRFHLQSGGQYVQNGGYSVRGMMIISDQAEKSLGQIMENWDLGVTYLQGEGPILAKGKKVM